MAKYYLLNKGTFEQAMARLERLEKNLHIKSKKECEQDFDELMSYCFLVDDIKIIGPRIEAIVDYLGLCGQFVEVDSLN